MTVTTIFKDINWSDHAHDEIKIIENYSPSNDYEGTDIEVNGEHVGGDIVTSDAVIKTFGYDLGGWLLRHMVRGQCYDSDGRFTNLPYLDAYRLPYSDAQHRKENEEMNSINDISDLKKYIEVQRVMHEIRSNAEIARRCGWFTSSFAKRLEKPEVMKLGDLQKIANAMDCDLCIQFIDKK